MAKYLKIYIESTRKLVESYEIKEEGSLNLAVSGLRDLRIVVDDVPPPKPKAGKKGTITRKRNPI